MQSMANLRNRRNMEHGKALLVDSAVLACKPPPARPLAERTRTPLQRYIRHLLLVCLMRERPGGSGGDKGRGGAGGDAVSEVLLRMRALPWGECDTDVLATVLKVRDASLR
jgi:hypothetical protein